MSVADINAEVWSAVFSIKPHHRERMAELGVPLSAIAKLGKERPPFGVARVRYLRDGLYEPDPGGEPAVIVPVCAHTSGELWDCLDFTDAIAFPPDNPARWSWRTGDGWALAENLLNEDAPVPVVADPLQWLAAAGDAFALLDWRLTPLRWERLRAGPPLQFADDALRTRFRNAIVKSAPMPCMETITNAA